MYLENDEIKFTVLYTLWRYETPIPFETLCLILTWEDSIMDYFTLAIKFGELTEDGFIKSTYTADKEKYCLTVKGEEAVDFFATRVPPSVRKSIDKTVGNIKYDELAGSNSIESEVVPLNAAGQFLTKCSILDDKTPLLDMSIFIGDRDIAERVAKHFKENATNIYREILKLCLPSDENTENEE